MRSEIGGVLQWLVNIFRFFGFCTNALPSQARNNLTNKVIIVWSSIVFALLNTVMTLVFIKSESFLYTEERFALFNDCLKLTATILSVDVSAWQCLRMGKNEQKFWTLYIQLRSSRIPLVKHMTIYNQLVEHRWFILKLLGIIIVNVTSYLMFALLYKGMQRKLVRFWIMYTPYAIVTGMRNAQFILYMELIRIEVKYLEKDLATLVEYTEWERPHRSFPHFDEFIQRRIAEKQKLHLIIFEMCESFQSACNWSMVVNLLRGYARVLVDWYYFVWSLTWLPIKDILLIPAILEIPMFLLTAKSVTNAAKFISYRVHNLKRSADNVATSVQIQNFSLQLLHQQIKIDGLGIASMDGYMLTKAVGSITTYMVFFIQFMPKFKSKYD